MLLDRKGFTLIGIGKDREIDMEAKKTEILLDVGTNELEILEFTIAGNSYGINVAKIRELLQYQDVQTVPRSNPFIEGVFKPRNEVLTVVDLATYLGLPDEENKDRHIFVCTSFNKMNIAFHVHSVESIHRVSWTAIEKPDVTIFGGEDGVVTGIAKWDNRIVSIVDFEKIIADISPQSSIQVSEVEAMGERPNSEKPILLAEDSELLRRMIVESLHKAGYSNIIGLHNGQEAWDKMVEFAEMDDDITNHVRLVITDIEMPLMDGHRFTKNIKGSPKLKKLPVIIFSSLIDEPMRIKGEQVGADAQLSKPEIGHLVGIIDRLIL